MPATDTDLYKQISEYLNLISAQHNFQVTKTAPIGKPASDKSNAHEYRMQLINTDVLNRKLSRWGLIRSKLRKK